MKTWFLLIGTILVLLVAAFFALSFYGVKFINAELHTVVVPNLTISEIALRPTHLLAKTVRYEEAKSGQSFVHIEALRIYPSLLDCLRGRIRIRELKLIRPSVFICRSRDGVIHAPWPREQEEGKRRGGDRGRQEERSFRVEIDRLRIENGSIHFEDRRSRGIAHVRLRDLEIELRHLQYPLTSAQSLLEGRGKFQGVTGDGEIHAKGWINLKTGDTETSFKANAIEVKVFEPYYRRRVSATIESGKMDLEARITVRQSRIDVPGKLGLTDLRVEEGEGTVLWLPAKTLVSVLREKGNRINIRFRVNGDLNDPRYDLQENLLTRVAIAMAEALGAPIKVDR
jgi:uncharacterized protein involved in outer membrane biogenesis